MGRIENWIASSLSLLAKTVSASFCSLLEQSGSCPTQPFALFANPLLTLIPA
jgi:hypothetical protein